MGNACATDRCTSVKPSRQNSELSYPTLPPAPRHSKLRLQSPIDEGEWHGQSITMDFIDEGGSPAVDVTKSQDSVREWIEHLQGSTDDITEISADVEDTKPADPNITLASMYVLAPTSYFDAEEEAARPKRRVVSALMLETPKLPSTGRKMF